MKLSLLDIKNGKANDMASSKKIFLKFKPFFKTQFKFMHNAVLRRHKKA